MASVGDVLDSVNRLLDAHDALGDDGGFGDDEHEFFARHAEALAAARRRFDEAHPDDGEVKPAFPSIVRESDAATAVAPTLRPGDRARINAFGRTVREVITKLDAGAVATLPRIAAAPRRPGSPA